MQVGIIGLGRMGKNIALQLLEKGVDVVAYNRSRDDIEEVVEKGATPAYKLKELAQKLTAMPSVVFLFVPAGTPTEEILFGAKASIDHEKDIGTVVAQKGLIDMLPPGAIVVDGGNSFFKDSQRRYKVFNEKKIYFLDMGTSGGLEGARHGACLMVGGDKEAYAQIEPVLAKIAAKDGYGYFGRSGAGHYVKMVHNAIEYGMMGAIAEGFHLVRESEFKLPFAKLAKVWAHGSIVSGHLMDMMTRAFEKDPELTSLEGVVPRGETEAEMEWLEMTYHSTHEVIQEARRERVGTRTRPSFIGKVLAALRREFGGHAVKEKSK